MEKQLKSYRLDYVTLDQINSLSKRYNKSQTDIIISAVALLDYITYLNLSENKQTDIIHALKWGAGLRSIVS